MAAATIVRTIDVADPAMEVVELEVTDGETYTSKKFKIVYGGVCTGKEDQDAAINVVPDGTTGLVTINYAAMTDKDVILVLFGRH